MKNDLSFKLLVAVILSGLVLACANATAPTTPTTPEKNSLQANSASSSPPMLHSVHTTVKS